MVEENINIMCPIKYIKITTNSPPWITQEVIEAINYRNCLFRQAKQTRDPNDLRAANAAGNRISKMIRIY